MDGISRQQTWLLQVWTPHIVEGGYNAAWARSMEGQSWWQQGRREGGKKNYEGEPKESKERDLCNIWCKYSYQECVTISHIGMTWPWGLDYVLDLNHGSSNCCFFLDHKLPLHDIVPWSLGTISVTTRSPICLSLLLSCIIDCTLTQTSTFAHHTLHLESL